MEWPIKSFRSNGLGSNIYVIFSERGIVVIDAGFPKDSAFKQVIHYLREFPGAALHQKPIYLFLTHYHTRHAGAAAKFKDNFSNIEILAHVDTMNYLNDIVLVINEGEPILCDQVIKGPKEFDFGNYILSSIPLPGHCAGHCAFLLHNIDDTTPSYDNKYLFTGDLLSKYTSSTYSMNDSNVARLIDSLRRASDLKFLIAFPGHGPTLVRRQFVTAAALSLIDLITCEENVLKCLSVPRSTEQICQYVFDGLLRTGTDLQSCLNMTLNHLKKLQDEGRVQNEQGVWVSLEKQRLKSDKNVL
ncbi:MAG: MBL fold metallo-hydrolase [Candidatus Heimdallarchaeota archaeon]